MSTGLMQHYTIIIIFLENSEFENDDAYVQHNIISVGVFRKQTLQPGTSFFVGKYAAQCVLGSYILFDLK